ncbi:MAG: sarcosine oxidase subunit gamma [Gemmobacter sp.]
MAEVTITRAAPQGMMTLKAPLGDPAVAAALGTLGLTLPARRRLVRSGARAAAWMAPDELLLLVPEAGAAMAALAPPLAGTHHLLADVSDARAVFCLAGPGTRGVLARLCPVDFDPGAFGPGDVRRSRAAQVAAAIWAEDVADFRLACFRSVEGYVAALLGRAAADERG